METEDYSISNIDEACTAFYGHDVNVQKRAHEYLLRLTEHPEAHAYLFNALNASTKIETLVFSTYGMARLCEKNWRLLNLQIRTTIRNWCMNWLFTRGPIFYEKRRQEESEVIKGVMRLLSVIVSNGWLEMSSSSRFITDVEVFLNSDTTLHWILALEVFEHVVAKIDPSSQDESGGKHSIRRRRTSASFRESALGLIFTRATRFLTQWGDGTLRVSEKWMESELLLESIRCIYQCLTFDFTGEIHDDSTDDATTLMIPYSWKALGISRLPPLLFAVLKKGINDPTMSAQQCSIHCLESLAALASIRQSFFAERTDRIRYQSMIVDEMESLIHGRTSDSMDVCRSILNSDEVYHGYCELAGRIMHYCMMNTVSPFIFSKWACWAHRLSRLSIDAFNDRDPHKLLKVKHEMLKAWVEVPAILDRRMPFGAYTEQGPVCRRETELVEMESVARQVILVFIESRFQLFASAEDDDVAGELVDELLNDVVLQEQVDLLSQFIKCHDSGMALSLFKEQGGYHAKICIDWIAKMNVLCRSDPSPLVLTNSTLGQLTFCIALCTSCLEAYKEQFKSVNLIGKYRPSKSGTVDTKTENAIEFQDITYRKTSQLIRDLIDLIVLIRPASLEALHRSDSQSRLENTILNSLQVMLELVLPEYCHAGEQQDRAQPNLLRYLSAEDGSSSSFFVVELLLQLLMDSQSIFDRSLDILESLMDVRSRPNANEHLVQFALPGNQNRKPLVQSIAQAYGLVGPVLASRGQIIKTVSALSQGDLLDETSDLLNRLSSNTIEQLFRILVQLEFFHKQATEEVLPQFHATKLTSFLKVLWPRLDKILEFGVSELDSNELNKAFRLCLAAVEGICYLPCDSVGDSYEGSYQEYIMSDIIMGPDSSREQQTRPPERDLNKAWLGTIIRYGLHLRMKLQNCIETNTDADEILEALTRIFSFTQNMLFPPLRNFKRLENSESVCVEPLIISILEFFGMYRDQMRVKYEYTKIKSECALIDLVATVSKECANPRQVDQMFDLYFKALPILFDRDHDTIQQYPKLCSSIISLIDCYPFKLGWLKPSYVAVLEMRIAPILEILTEGLYTTDEQLLHRIINSLTALCDQQVEFLKSEDTAQQQFASRIVEEHKELWDRLLATIFRLITTASSSSVSWSLSQPFLAISLLRPATLERITEEQLSAISGDQCKERATRVYRELMESIVAAMEEREGQKKPVSINSKFSSDLFTFATLQKNMLMSE
eukprot:GHVH01010954.1.p1 GENE.GHVH01010954.1~~GHVH01010954.1.p1  ORF type:complete len:1236 (+),score=215.19 GHVH01010954.1:114-3821(+)